MWVEKKGKQGVKGWVMGPVGIATSNNLLIELRIMSIVELLERHHARQK